MKFMRYTAILLIVGIVASVCIPALAHSSLQGNLFDGNGSSAVGSNGIGWIIDETQHLNTTSITFKFDDVANGGFSSTQKTQIRNGFSKRNKSPLSVTETTSAIGLVRKNTGLGPNQYSQITGSVNNSGHITQWMLELNPSSSLTTIMIARELGLIIGLRSLSSSSNKNKIMYGGNDGTATTTHTQDIWGARVITGNHSSHSWEYVYVSNDKHRHRCTSCGGYKTQGCTPNSSGYCTKCGHYVSNSGNGVTDPAAALLPNSDEDRRSMIGIPI